MLQTSQPRQTPALLTHLQAQLSNRNDRAALHTSKQVFYTLTSASNPMLK